MTWSKFHKNCIITGFLDGFCLVCEEHMKDEDEFNLHLETTTHQKKVEATPYFEKYKHEYIRKVKKGYYCEFCNILFFTASKAGLHIAEAQHKYKKGSCLLKRIDNNKLVVAFNNILIGDSSWNGFIDKTCVVCNTEFDDTYLHKKEQDHILNLIQRNVEFGDDESVYRKLDESSFQCLICNIVVALDNFSAHFKDANHVERLKTTRTAGEVTIEYVEKKSTTGLTIGVGTTPLETVIKETQPNTKNEVKKTVQESVIPPIPSKKDHKFTTSNEKRDNNAKTNTNEGNDNNPQKLERNSIKSPLEMDEYMCKVLGAENYITRNLEGACVCLLCDWNMGNAVITAHVNGRHHQTLLKLHKQRLNKLSETKQTSNKVEEKKRKETSDEDKSKVLDSLQEFQKNDINVNFEMNVATCKKCSQSFGLEFNLLKNHIEEHKKINNKKDSKSSSHQSANGNKNKENVNTLDKEARDEEQIENFAKKYKLSYKNGNVTCQVCNTKLIPTIKCLEEHVESAHHKGRAHVASVQSSTLNIIKVPMNIFITSIVSLKTFPLTLIIINEKYNITLSSFWMITDRNNVMKCEPCEEMLDIREVESHRLTFKHTKAMSDTMVITGNTSLYEEEFIREPRPNVYHCGYCCEVAFGLETMVEHLKTTSHADARRAAQWRMVEHSSDVQKKKWDEAMGRSVLASMLNQLRSNESSDDE